MMGWMSVFILLIVISFGLRIGLEKHMMNKLRQKEEALKGQFNDILAEEVSYEEFKKISGETLAQNSPVRSCGDFFEFMSDVRDDMSEKYIENRIRRMYVGDENV